MATLQVRITALITAIKTETKALRTFISGTDTGDVSGLATTASDLVGAVNEVKITADAAAGGGVAINDAVTNTADAWSSSKIAAELTATQTAAETAAATNTTTQIAAALEGEDLSDLAAQVTANAQADVGFVTFAGVQSLSAPQVTQFGANIGLGEPDTDLVAAWNAA